jgi:hypothetical protein
MQIIKKYVNRIMYLLLDQHRKAEKEQVMKVMNQATRAAHAAKILKENVVPFSRFPVLETAFWASLFQSAKNVRTAEKVLDEIAELEDEPCQEKINLVITSLPTLNKAGLVSIVGVDHVSEEAGNHIASILKSFSGVNEKLRQRGIPTVAIMLGHIHRFQTWERDFCGVRQIIAYQAQSVGSTTGKRERNIFCYGHWVMLG